MLGDNTNAKLRTEIDYHWVRILMVPMHLGLIDGPSVPKDRNKSVLQGAA